MSAVLTCPDCGARFECRPGQGCWCESVPAVAPVPREGTCVCPCQLGRIAAQAEPARDASAVADRDLEA